MLIKNKNPNKCGTGGKRFKISRLCVNLFYRIDMSTYAITLSTGGFHIALSCFSSNDNAT